MSTSVLWVLLTLCSGLTSILPILTKVATHGKCHSNQPSRPDDDKERNRESKSVISRLNDLADIIHELLLVPKKLFIHLYVIGFGCAIYHLLHHSSSFHDTDPVGELGARGGGVMGAASNLLLSAIQLTLDRVDLVLLLWTFHVLRRLLESLLMTHYGESRMHLGGYIAGVVHYIAVPLCFREISPVSITCDENGVSVPVSGWCITIPLLLFFAANYYQYEAHLILFRMKIEQLKSAHPNVYHLPTQSWFRLVCVPHYTAEVLIYMSLAALMLPRASTHAPLLLVVWVTSNLAVVAQAQHSWYQRQYPDEVPKVWYKLFPYIW
jgi:hypothetical protein